RRWILRALLPELRAVAVVDPGEAGLRGAGVELDLARSDRRLDVGRHEVVGGAGIALVGRRSPLVLEVMVRARRKARAAHESLVALVVPGLGREHRWGRARAVGFAAGSAAGVTAVRDLRAAAGEQSEDPREPHRVMRGAIPMTACT